MKTLRIGLGFLVAVAVAAALGSIVQTHFNMTFIEDLGVPIPAGLRLRVALEDLIRFAPLYGLLVAIGFLCAFAVARFPARRFKRARWFWFALAGGAAVLATILGMNALMPVTPIAATRMPLATAAMVLAGAFGGWIYAALTRAAAVS